MSSTSYCNTCFKAGKSPKEYTSHNTKEKRGNNVVVVCPIILATKCKACNQLGHWANIKFCPLLKHQERERNLQARLERETKTETKKKTCVSTINRFAILDDLDDASDHVDVVPFVPLKMSETPVKGISYAQMAVKEKQLVDPYGPLRTSVRNKRKWTDYDDSSDEENEINYSRFDSNNDELYDEWKINC